MMIWALDGIEIDKSISSRKTFSLFVIINRTNHLATNFTKKMVYTVIALYGILPQLMECLQIFPLNGAIWGYLI